MKRPSRNAGRAVAVEARMWTQSRARAATPYLGSVVRSLRELTVAIHGNRRRLNHLEQLPGRPTRATLIAIADLRRELDQLTTQLADTASELENVGAALGDPVQGVALLPFTHDARLAWFVFDLFDEEPLRWWRYQEDPEDFRRPLTPAQTGVLATAV